MKPDSFLIMVVLFVILVILFFIAIRVSRKNDIRDTELWIKLAGNLAAAQIMINDNEKIHKNAMTKEESETLRFKNLYEREQRTNKQLKEAITKAQEVLDGM